MAAPRFSESQARCDRAEENIVPLFMASTPWSLFRSTLRAWHSSELILQDASHLRNAANCLAPVDVLLCQLLSLLLRWYQLHHLEA